MASSDFTVMGSGLDTSNVARGVTQGKTPPAGGGSFVYGWNSLTVVEGVVGMVVNGANFFPLAEGQRISAAIQKNGGQDCAVMLTGAMSANDVTADCYMIGLTHNEEPSHLVVVKGSPQNGILESGAGELVKSAATFAQGVWVHIMMDIIVQPHGGVHLQVFQNDLSVNDVDAPVWDPISGMDEYIDDALGINSGSLPYASGGYGGSAFYTNAIGRYGLIDQLTVARQL